MNLFSLCWAANIASVANKVGSGDTATAGAGKQWQTTCFVVDPSDSRISDQLIGLMLAKSASILVKGT